MKIKKLALIAPAAVAAALAFPALANAGVPPAFQSPSGNVMCWVSDNIALCRAIEHAYTLPSDHCAKPASPNGIMLRAGEAPRATCDSSPNGTYDGLRTETTLDYGQTRSKGVMNCVSEESGVTCTDTSTGHFFRISKESYQFG